MLEIKREFLREFHSNSLQQQRLDTQSPNDDDDDDDGGRRQSALRRYGHMTHVSYHRFISQQMEP